MKKLLYIILIGLVIVFGILLYSRFIGTKGLRVNEIGLGADIPVSYEGLKIVHFSDLHYKKVITEKQIEDVVKEINKIKADIVLFTGDLIDKEYTLKNSDINFLIEELSKITSKYGSYAVLGDHDYIMEEEIKSIYLQSNFILLENDYTIVYNENNDKILIGGIGSAIQERQDIQKLLKDMKPEEIELDTKIILAHEPDSIAGILNVFDTDIIFSGHSINGSINIPGIKQLLLPKGAKSYYLPYYKVKDTDIFISNGIGVNNINFRLYNTPSINFYRLKKSN